MLIEAEVVELDAPDGRPTVGKHLPKQIGCDGASVSPLSGHPRLLISAADGPRRSRGLRGHPRALLAMSILAAAGVSIGIAQWRHRAVVETTSAELTRQLSALHLGKLQLASTTPVGTGEEYDAQGRRMVAVWLSVRNGGPNTVHVSAQGIPGDYVQLTEPQGAKIAAGASSILTLPLAVDCSAIPRTASSATGSAAHADSRETGESWVELRVDADGRAGGASKAWRYDTLPVVAYSLPGVLAQACVTS